MSFGISDDHGDSDENGSDGNDDDGKEDYEENKRENEDEDGDEGSEAGEETRSPIYQRHYHRLIRDTGGVCFGPSFRYFSFWVISFHKTSPELGTLKFL